MYVRMYACMYVCMYVCTYVHLCRFHYFLYYVCGHMCMCPMYVCVYVGRAHASANARAGSTVFVSATRFLQDVI